MRRVISVVASVCLMLLAGGCVTDVAKTSSREEIKPLSTPAQPLRLYRPLELSLRSGYSVPEIKAGSIWQLSGSIPQGIVFKPVDTILTVDAGNKYQAYLVVHNSQVVGVFLPVESAFVVAREPVSVQWQEVKTRP